MQSPAKFKVPNNNQELDPYAARDPEHVYIHIHSTNFTPVEDLKGNCYPPSHTLRMGVNELIDIDLDAVNSYGETVGHDSIRILPPALNKNLLVDLINLYKAEILAPGAVNIVAVHQLKATLETSIKNLDLSLQSALTRETNSNKESAESFI